MIINERLGCNSFIQDFAPPSPIHGREVTPFMTDGRAKTKRVWLEFFVQPQKGDSVLQVMNMISKDKLNV